MSKVLKTNETLNISFQENGLFAIRGSFETCSVKNHAQDQFCDPLFQQIFTNRRSRITSQSHDKHFLHILHIYFKHCDEK